MHARMIHGQNQSGEHVQESQQYDAKGRVSDGVPVTQVHVNHKCSISVP